MMIWELVEAPVHWVTMLRNQEIHAEEEEYIDLNTFTSRIYRKVLKEGEKNSKHFRQLTEIITDSIFVFLEEVNIIICDYYNFGKKILIEKMDQLKANLENSSILNIYTLYKILRDLSVESKNQIMDFIREGMFRHIQLDICESFARYVIEKFEVLDMKTLSGTN